VAVHGAQAAAARCKAKHRHKCKAKPKTPTGPSLTVAGFSLNQTFVASATKMTNPSVCAGIVGASSAAAPGPPQNVDFAVYMKATGIPADAPTQEQYSIPEAWGGYAGLNVQATLSAAAPWSRVFGAGPGPFGGPPGSGKSVFHGGNIGFDDENGPSANEFDGTYTWTTSVVVGARTLSSTGTATVAC
jgi:hypothetical protein